MKTEKYNLFDNKYIPYLYRISKTGDIIDHGLHNNFNVYIGYRYQNQRKGFYLTENKL
jgi:hypothetical protein